MSARIGLLSTLAVGCLLVGCSPTPSTTTDGGTVDAGKADAGKTDAGPVGGQVGENCINNGGQVEQSTCATDLVCIPLSQENTTLTVCTKECTTNADCGVGTGGAANFCWSGICWQGCSAGTTCNQSDFSCQDGFVQNTGLCIPDCEQQAKSFCSEFFGYPFNVCDTGSAMAQGSCLTAGENALCSATMACTGSNEACFPLPTRPGSPAQAVCVNDCTAAGVGDACRNNTECVSDNCVSGHCAACEQGFACDSSGGLTNGTCQIVLSSDYGYCTRSAQCPGDDICLNFSQTGVQGLCLATCTANSDCAAGTGGTTAKCNIDLTNGQKVCSLDCSAAGSVCPPDTACANIGAPIGSICVPSPGANAPTDGGPVDAGPVDAGTDVDAGP